MKLYIFLIFISLFILNIFSLSFAAVNDEAKTKNDALASVVILNFINKSNLRQYEYLSAGFSEAMRSTLNTLFTYTQVNNTETHKTLQQILQKSKQKWHQIKLINIKALAEQEKLDVIIYGEYIRLKTKKKDEINHIKITTKIYFSFLDEEITLNTRVSKLDHSISSVMKKIAKSSVGNIHKHIDFTATKDEKNQRISPVLVIPINQNIKMDGFEAELKYMRSQLDRNFTAKISLIDYYMRKKIDVNIQTPKEKRKILSTLVRTRRIKQMIQISTNGNLFKMTLITRGRPVKMITYRINASEQIKYGYAKETANFFKLKAKGVKTATKKKNSVILILPQLNTPSGDEQENKQTDIEINHIKKAIADHYDVQMLFFTEHLKKNIFLTMPSDTKKDFLKSLIKKDKIHKFLKVKMEAGLITTKVIVNYKFKRQFTYSIGASNAIKKVNFQKMAYTLGLKKENVIRRGKTAFKISALQKIKKSDSTTKLNRNWQNIIYEVGLNPFYQLSWASFSDVHLLSHFGGGLTLYSRISINQIQRLFTKSGTLNQPTKKFGGWLSALHLGASFTPVYSQSDTPLQNNFLQNYLFSFELSYLYPITKTWRLGLGFRPGFYLAYLSSNNGVFTKNVQFRNIVLPITLEVNYLINSSLILNVGLSENLYGLTSNSFIHGVGILVGFSWGLG